MKKYLLLGLILIALMNAYASTLIHINIAGVSYTLSISYVYISFVFIFIMGWLTAYQWQLLKIYILQWRLKRTQKELFQLNQRFYDQAFLLQFLDQEQSLSLYKDIMPIIPRPITSDPESLEWKIKELSVVLSQNDYVTAQSLLAKLQKKLPTSLSNLLMSKIYLTKLSQNDEEYLLVSLKKWPQWMWQQPQVLSYIFHHLERLDDETKKIILKKINPLDLTKECLDFLEQVIKNNPSQWLTFFYQYRWNEVALQSDQLALLLIRLNVHSGFIGQAQLLAQQLSGSFLKEAVLDMLETATPHDYLILDKT